MAKLQYWWGSDNPIEAKYFIVAILFGLLVTSATLFFFAESIQNGRPAIEDSLSFESVSGLLMVSIGWIFLVASVTSGQAMTKMLDDEVAKEVALRSLGNTLEYGLMTILLIWMHGVYCNAVTATILGGGVCDCSFVLWFLLRHVW